MEPDHHNHTPSEKLDDNIFRALPITVPSARGAIEQKPWDSADFWIPA